VELAHLPSPPLGSLGPDLGRIRISVAFDLRAQVDRLIGPLGLGDLLWQAGQLVQHLAKVASDRLRDLEPARFLNEPASDQQPRQGRRFLQDALKSQPA
jgi:hypothetical protein